MRLLIARCLLIIWLAFSVKQDDDLYGDPITISSRGDGALGSSDIRAETSTAQMDMADKLGRSSALKDWVPNGF